MSGNHDIGGLQAGPINTDEGDPEPWQKMLTAVYGALVSRGHGTVDQLRRHLEALSKEQYELPYYERWVEAMCNLMEEKGLLTREEIANRMTALKAEMENTG